MGHDLRRVRFAWFPQIRTVGVQVGCRSRNGNDSARVVGPAALGAVSLLVGCGPAGEEFESVVGRCAGIGGVGGEGESFVRFEGHSLKHEIKEADGGVTEVLQAGAVQAHVVGRP